MTGRQVEPVIVCGPVMRAIAEIIDQVAATDATVLVCGESGVGKEMVARALHQRSPREERPLIRVNCAALPVKLLESELFGYERRAFTGAHRPTPGQFERADRGTIFLDEVGELPLSLQGKLLHVLQDPTFARLGGRQDVRVDVRVIAATSKDLGRLVERGAFREDLYYWLDVVRIHVPPLRQRREEIPILVEHFLGKYAQQYGRPRREVSAETMRRILNHSWPGNIRELENLIKRIVVLGSEQGVNEELASRQVRAGSAAGKPAGAHPAPGRGLKDIARRAAREAERAALKETLEQVHWNRVAAARRLEISYRALLNKIRDCGLRD